MRIIVSIASLLMLAQVVWGQSSLQNPYFTPFSQYYFQQSMLNPAYVGNENQPQYWLSYQSSQEPSGTGLNAGLGDGRALSSLIQGRMYSVPINYGVILNYEEFDDPLDTTDVIGFRNRGDFKQWQAGLQASFDFDVGEKGIGRVGLTGSVIYLNNCRTNPQLCGRDVGADILRKYAPNLDIGIILIYGNFELGMSVVNSSQPSLGLRTPGTTGGGGGIGGGGVVGGTSNSTFRRTSYISMLYNWDLNSTFSLHPQMLLRMGDGRLNPMVNAGGGGVNLSGVSLDLTMILNYYDLFFLGYSYKPNLSSGTALTGFAYTNYFSTIMAGVRIADAYQISVAWDLVRPDISNKNKYRKLEVGIGAFLFQGFYFEEEPTDL